jgi:hypothetical protein
MNFPPRVIVALIIAAVLAALALLAITRLPYARHLPLTPPQRRGLAALVAAVLALVSAWVVFILPAYWD